MTWGREHLGQMAPLLDPALVTEHAVAEVIARTPQPSQAPGRRGRPAIGPQVNVSFQKDLLARVDAAADRAGLTRAAWLRQAAAAEAARAEQRAAVD
ncbi:hypothetical protein ACH4FX_40485 [Streptomyces sp. NPDC018019]|uniref:hypothetical protein n=1 Tax=Streptomyces sp. NPDC018019 TaxID=3365030 RepID=UPI0037AB559A